MTDKEYFALKALSKSQVRYFRPDNPLAFWNNTAFNPEKKEVGLTDDMAFGKLTHAMLFEREKVKDMFIVNDELGKSRTNKKWREAQATTEKTIVTTEEYTQASKMVCAVMSYQLYRDLLKGVKSEVPYTWYDKDWDMPCKAKIDAIKNTSEGLCIIDYKTTGKIDSVTRFIDNGGYQYDVGFYNRMCRAKYKDEHGRPLGLASFIFLFQSNKEGEEHLIKVKKVTSINLEACDVAVDFAVRNIKERLDRYNGGDLGAWLSEPCVEEWDVSPTFDRYIETIGFGGENAE